MEFFQILTASFCNGYMSGNFPAPSYHLEQRMDAIWQPGAFLISYFGYSRQAPTDSEQPSHQKTSLSLSFLCYSVTDTTPFTSKIPGK